MPVTKENKRSVLTEEVLKEVNKGREELLDLRKDYIAKLISFQSVCNANNIILEGEAIINTIFLNLIAISLTVLSILKNLLQTTPRSGSNVIGSASV